jgi:glycerate dehydrogenase
MKPDNAFHIVVIDGATLNPGDLSWEALGASGSYQVYPHSTAQEILERCREADAILTNKAALDRATILALPELKYIGVTATGYNIVDIEAASSRGIVVTNVPTYGTDSVAQMAFALLLELTQHVGHHAQTVRQGRWSKSDDFCYWDYPLVELAGLTMGIVGCGRIGQATARLADAFGMKVIGYDIVPFDSGRVPIEPAGLEELFASSDVVSLHCPFTPANAGMVNAQRLAYMKPTAFLINTSRGALVNEPDLAQALNTGRLAGAGLDVLSTEPPQPDNPLLEAQNCIITPHIAWATVSARRRLLQTSIENLEAFIAGTPQNTVNHLAG